MNPPSDDDDSLTSFLSDYDAARAAGLTSRDSDSSTVADPPDGQIKDQLDQVFACLDLLHRRWPWHTTEPIIPAEEKPKAADKGPINLGRYEIRRLLGVGGHGIVYLTFDPFLKRTVALKLPKPDALASAQLRKRFLREARALARLEHPGIVPIHDIGEAGPVCYLAMAHIDGPNLAEWLERRDKPLDADAAARIGLMLAEAMAHAHSRNVLHRDLKPSNILLERPADPEAAPTPRITDFGLAKILDDLDDETRTGTLPLGTPRFASPEQKNGQLDRIGPATDVWGLGTILHAMLAHDPDAGPASETRDAIPDQPDALRSIINRCLQDDPKDRYQTARALADDLIRFLAGQRVRADRVGLRPLVRAWNRFGQAALLTACILAAGMLAIGRLSRGRPASDALPAEPILTAAPAADSQMRQAQYIDDIRTAFKLIGENHDIRHGVPLLDRWADGKGAADPRGFEWGYLKNLAHGESKTLRHENRPDGMTPSEVYHVRFSSDGRTIVSAGQDRTVRIWDTETGQPRGVLRHPDEVDWVDLSHDGRLAATASDDGMVRIWDLASRWPHSEFPRAHGGKGAVCVLFTPDQHRLISAGRDGRLAVWDAATGEKLHQWDVGIDEVESLAVTSDGSRIVAGGNGLGQIAVIDTDRGRTDILKISKHKKIQSVALSPDGRDLAVAVGTEVILLDIPQTAPERILRDHASFVYSVAFSPDGTTLASGGNAEDYSIRLWDVKAGHVRNRLSGHVGRIWSLAFAPNGDRLASASSDGTVKLWDLKRPKDRTVKVYSSDSQPVAFGVSQDGTALLAAHSDGQVSRCDVATGEPLDSRQFFSTKIKGAVFSPDGRMLAAVPEKNDTLLIRDLSGRRELQIAGQFSADKQRLVFSDDYRLAAVRGGDSNCMVIDVLSGLTLDLPPIETPIPTTPGFLAFSPDGRNLFGTPMYRINRIVAWDSRVGTSRPRNAPEVSPSWILSQTVSPDGRVLASGNLSNSIELRDAETLRIRSSLYGHDYEVSPLVFSPDGKVLASGDTGGAIRLWNIATSKELFALEKLTFPVRYLRFTPDGANLIFAADGLKQVVICHAR